MSDITVVGSLNLDTTAQVARLPKPGETVLGSGHFSDTGGKGANQAVAAARLGRSVSMLGAVGNDDAGQRLLRALLTDGVNVDAISRSSEPTGIALITVDESGENTIVVSPGANGAYTVDDLDEGQLQAASVVLAQLEIPIPTVTAAATQASRFLLNPAPAQPLSAELLAATEVLIPNSTEAALIAGVVEPATPDEAVDVARLIEGPDAVVVTLGALGAVVVEGSSAVAIAAPKIEAVDPTAAGDAFCAALADALVGDATLVEAARWAVRAGAVTATRWGAQAALPSREDVESMEAA